MNDTADGPIGAGLSRSGAEPRLSELERRIARLEVGAAAPGNRSSELEAELGVLREAVADLAASNLDLHNQLAKLVSSCERILAGAGDGAAVSGRRSGLSRSASFVGRAARRVVRGTISAARRLTGSRSNGPAAAVELEIELAGSPARRAPRIAVVMRTTEDPAAVELPSVLRRQSEPDLAVVVWNEGGSTAAVHLPGAEPVVVDAPDRRAVAAAASAGLVVEAAPPLPRLHPTLLERCRWTVASENLPLLIVDLAGETGAGGRLEPATDWVARAANGRGAPQPKLVKAVGGGRWGAIDRRDSVVVGAGFCRGYVVAPGRSGSVVHRVAPLEGVVEPVASGGDDRTVLILASRRAGQLTSWVLRSLADDHRCIVALAGAEDGSPLSRALTELGARVYPIDGFLEPEVRPSLVADLVRANRAQTMIRVGGGIEVPRFDESRPRVVDLPLHRCDVAADADLVLALGRDIAEAASKLGVATMDLVPGPTPTGGVPVAEELAGIRSAYGVSDEARLVLAVCDLEPAHRPEDVTAVARRLRRLDDVAVLLVGQGSLAGSISDLAGYFELDRFSLAPPGHSLTELAAVSDCVLCTAEIDPWPVAVGTALALGRSVVATEIDGVRELAAAAGFDRCVLCPPGDVDALAAAVTEALDTHRRPRATKKAWSAAAARSAAAADVLRTALGRVATGGAESR